LIEEYGITQEELARVIHKSRSHIANTMRLLQLDDYAIDKIVNGEISQGHAKVLVGLAPEEQRVICDTIVGQKLSVRETEALCRAHAANGRDETPKKERKAPASRGFDLRVYEDLVAKAFPIPVRIKANRIEIVIDDEMTLKTLLKALERVSS
jgi:ParB family chromosome partitioning protein